MKKKLSHVDSAGNPKMVDVSDKEVTLRTARAQAVVHLGKKLVAAIKDDELITKKGPVFKTAMIAGVMGAKRTSELIPFCHPLGLEDCQIQIEIKGVKAIIETLARIKAKTGVEMEALMAATIAALTVYDMCKALSHNIVIEEVKLLEKRGGRRILKENSSTLRLVAQSYISGLAISVWSIIHQKHHITK